MQEFLSYNINGIPLVFWGFMVALVLAMHCMAGASQRADIAHLDDDDEAGIVPQPINDVAIR